jgi:hypothetical protein
VQFRADAEQPRGAAGEPRDDRQSAGRQYYGQYGNTFMIVAGLLNALVVLDAFDIGMGRK